MSRKFFYITWVIQSVLLVAGTYFLVYLWYDIEILSFLLLCIGLLGLKTILLFELTHLPSIRTSNKILMKIVYSNFLLKLILAVGIPWIYITMHQPASTDFIVLYLLIYISYLILETRALHGAVSTKPESMPA